MPKIIDKTQADIDAAITAIKLSEIKNIGNTLKNLTSDNIFLILC